MVRNLRHIIATVLLMGIAISADAQYVVVKDAAFANFLCDSFPQVMSPDCMLLDTVKAKMLTGKMTAVSRGISSISEISYFEKIWGISFADNAITKLPNLTNLSNLTLLNLKGNMLADTINLSSCLLIDNLILNRNSNLTAIVGLETMKNLENLQLIACNFSSIPDIQSLLTLTKLYLYQNKLTYSDLLPLTNHPGFSATFTVFPQNNTTNDTTVRLGIDSSYTMVYQEDSGVAGLRMKWLKDGIEIPQANGSSYTITKFASVDAGVYQVIVYSDNAFFAADSIKSGKWTVSEAKILDVIDIAISRGNECIFNQMTIDAVHFRHQVSDYKMTVFNRDFEQKEEVLLGKSRYYLPGMYDLIVSRPGYVSDTLRNAFSIADASSCTIDTVIVEHQSVVLTTDISERILFDSIVWYKNAQYLNANSASYSISDFSQSDEGTYYCHLYYNDGGGTRRYFVSETWHCRMAECQTVLSYDLIQLDNCSKIEYLFRSIELQNPLVSSLYIENVFNKKRDEIKQGIPFSVVTGEYNLIVTDNHRCEKVFARNIAMKPAADCNKYFTPNNDGIDDVWYIGYEGQIEIFDPQGNLIHKLTGPTYWDGKNRFGSAAPDGKYLIINGDKSTEVITLFR